MQSPKALERRTAAGKDSPSERRKQSDASRPAVAKKRRGGRLTESRRGEIVRKAAQLFLDKGYESVTVDDIIALIGGSKATLYSQFSGKDGLFEIVIRGYCAEVGVAINFDTTGDTAEQLLQIGHAFLKMVLSPRILALHRLMVSIGKKFPATAHLFYKCGPLSSYKIVAAWIEKQQAAGNLGGGNPYDLAVLFLDMLVGKHQLALLLSVPRVRVSKSVDETVRAAVSVFLHGAAARPS
jgi:TetR/AcrR family transcriptional regulator, mexJK operon transcriptional repressor